MILSGGLATPSEKMSNVYSTDKITDWSGAAKTGYFIGLKLKVPIDDFAVYGSVAYNHFPDAPIKIVYNNITFPINVSNNIIPVTAGVNYYFFRKIVSCYALGDVSYNYIYSSVDGTLPITDTKSPTDNRIGFGLGLGLDFNLKVLLLNVEAKYNLANQIGAKSGEPKKSYFNLGIGVGF